MSISEPRPIVSIILAAGNGTRMCSPGRHKVTMPVAGMPVLERAIRIYGACGIKRHVVVVGSLSEQVRHVASQAGADVTFVTQCEQRGTAHATRIAAAVLERDGYDGDVFVVAGDKVLEPAVIARLLDAFHRSASGLAFLVGDASDFPTAGRVVMGKGSASVVEVADIVLARLLEQLGRLAKAGPVSAEYARRLAREAFRTERMASKALGPMWLAIDTGRPLVAADIPAPNDEALAALTSAKVNLSVYLFRAPALYAALGAISADNAQGEEYLTDAVRLLAAGGERVVAVPIAQSKEVMAFNTPEELAAVRRHFERSGAPPPLAQQAISEFAVHYGRNALLVTRSPGRLNLMGRHIDHQGGASNLIAIGREMYLAVARRDDGLVRLHSGDPRFPDREFRVNGSPEAFEWLAYVNSSALRDSGASLKGDWSLYVRAAVERLTAEAGRALCGMDVVAVGNIPIAAGLSSSSALVVATAEALAQLNGLHIARERLVELCGEAEWFVGTRGGAGDHAAMILAREGQVTQVEYYPFGVVDSAPIPPGNTFVVFNSGIPARKTAGAKSAFNLRIACYHIGRELLKQALPLRADRVSHLRDVNEDALEIIYADLLRLLKTLPETLTVGQARRIAPDVVETHLEPNIEDGWALPVRAVVVFGLAECARARRCLNLLRAGDAAGFGRWMNVSHDGDRIANLADTSDAAMDRWIAAAEAGLPSAALELQPGAYGCSLPQLDAMVDIALSVPGVMGAQLSGAGLGGCIMALVQDNAIDALEEAMALRYYQPAGIAPEVIRCHAAAASGIVR